MKEKKVLTCSKCGQHFTSKQNCIRHETNIHSMHGGVRKSYCPSCNSSFTRTADLSRHMRRQHGTLLSSVFGTPKAAPIELPTAINLPKIPKVKPAATVSQRPASSSAVDSSTISEVTLEEDPLSGTCLKIDKPLNLAPRKRRKEDPKSPEKLTPRYGVRDRLLNLYSPALPLNTPLDLWSVTYPNPAVPPAPHFLSSCRLPLRLPGRVLLPYRRMRMPLWRTSQPSALPAHQHL